QTGASSTRSSAGAPGRGEGRPMLTVDAVDVFIQASHILRSVSLGVGPREVVCLVGRNGAGKTTTLRTIMGYLRPRAGGVEFRGHPIHGRRTHEIARLGVGWAPEDCGIFGDLTVAENIEIATRTRPGGRPATERIELAFRVFPMLRRYAGRKGPELSGGERKMLSIARALALDPELLVLDEPFEGLAPAIIPAVSEGLEAMFDDAVQAAVRDMETAGIDIITDGEVRRLDGYVDSYYAIIKGIEPIPDRRKAGPWGYDQQTRYEAVGRIETPPGGLGIVKEFESLKAHTTRHTKATCAGPLTFGSRIHPGKVYKGVVDVAERFAEVINQELRALVAAGAEFIQID